MAKRGSMHIVHLPGLTTFRPEKFLPELVYGSAGVHAFLLCLVPGQGLPPRRDSEEVVCYVIEGRVRLTVGEEETLLEAGDLAGVAPGVLRSLAAAARAVVLWIHVGNSGTATELPTTE